MKTHIKFYGIFGLSLILSLSSFAQGKWTTDKSHTSVKFTVTHLVISEVEGKFKDFTGTMISSKPDFSDAVIDFTINVASISTDNESRDKHLRSDEFFDAEKYPQITFKSLLFKKLKKNKYALIGNLTMKDVTKQVKFDVTYGGTAKIGNGRTVAGFKAISSINRFDYNVNWNSITETGSVVVGPIVKIQVDLEFRLATSN